MPWDQLTADIAVEVFFDDEAMCLNAMNQNDHENENLLGMKHQLPHGGRQTVLVKKSSNDNATKLYDTGNDAWIKE